MVRVKLRGILVDELGVNEIKLNVTNLQDLFNKLEEFLPNVQKALVNSRPRSYICIAINNSALNNIDPTQFSNIKLHENDLTELIPIASGG